MKRRILAWLLVLGTVLTSVPVFVLPVLAEGETASIAASVAEYTPADPTASAHFDELATAFSLDLTSYETASAEVKDWVHKRFAPYAQEDFLSAVSAQQLLDNTLRYAPYYKLYVMDDSLTLFVDFAGASVDNPDIVGLDETNEDKYASQRFNGAEANYIPYLIRNIHKGEFTGGTSKITAPWTFTSYYHDPASFFATKAGGSGAYADMITDANKDQFPNAISAGTSKGTVDGVANQTFNIYKVDMEMTTTEYYIGNEGKWAKKCTPSTWQNGYIELGLGSRFQQSNYSTIGSQGMTVELTCNNTGTQYYASRVVIGAEQDGTLRVTNGGGLTNFPGIIMTGLNTGMVHTLSVTYDIGEGKKLSDGGAVDFAVYGDGKQYYSSAKTEDAVTLTAEKNFCIGEIVNGKIYNIRVYNRALTEAEVAQNHFADIASRSGMDLSLLEGFSDAQMQEIYDAFALISIETSKEQVEDIICREFIYHPMYVQDGLIGFLDAATASASVTSDRYGNTVSITKADSEALTAEKIYYNAVLPKDENGKLTGEYTVEAVANFGQSAKGTVFYAGGILSVLTQNDPGANFSLRNNYATWRGTGNGGNIGDAMYEFPTILNSDGSVASMPSDALYTFVQSGSVLSTEQIEHSVLLTERAKADSLYANVTMDTCAVTSGNNVSLTGQVYDGVIHEKLTADQYTLLDGNYAFIYRESTHYATDVTVGSGKTTDQIYMVRIYDRILTAEESAQNHFADIAVQSGMDLSLLEGLSEADRKTVYEVFAAQPLELSKEEAENILRRAIYQTLYVQDGLIGFLDAKAIPNTAITDVFGNPITILATADGSGICRVIFSDVLADADGKLYDEHTVETILDFRGVSENYAANGGGGNGPVFFRAGFTEALQTKPTSGDQYMKFQNNVFTWRNDNNLPAFRYHHAGKLLSGVSLNSVHVYTYTVQKKAAPILGYAALIEESTALTQGLDYYQPYSSTNPTGLFFVSGLEGSIPDDASYDAIARAAMYADAHTMFDNHFAICYNDASGADTNVTVRVGADAAKYGGEVHAVRVYNKVLSETERARNHTVDLLAWNELPVTAYLSLTSEQQAQADTAMADVSLDASKEDVQAKLERVIYYLTHPTEYTSFVVSTSPIYAQQKAFSELAIAHYLDIRPFTALSAIQKEYIYGQMQDYTASTAEADVLAAYATALEEAQTVAYTLVVYDRDGIPSERSLYGDSFTVSFAAPKEGEKFVGYFSEADGNGMQITDATGAKLLSYTLPSLALGEEPRIVLYPYYTAIDYKAFYVTDADGDGEKDLILHLNFADATTAMQLVQKANYMYQTVDATITSANAGDKTGQAYQKWQYSTDNGTTWKDAGETNMFGADSNFTPFLFQGEEGDVYGGTLYDWYLDQTWPKDYKHSEFGDGYFSLGGNSRLYLGASVKNAINASTGYTMEFTVKNYNKENTATSTGTVVNYLGGRWSFKEKETTATYAANTGYNVAASGSSNNVTATIDSSKLNSYTVIQTMVDADGAQLTASSDVNFAKQTAMTEAAPFMKLAFGISGTALTEQTYKFKWDALGALFGDTGSVSAHVYNIRIYTKVLTTEQSAQNHFADIAYRYRFTAPMLEAYGPWTQRKRSSSMQIMQRSPWTLMRPRRRHTMPSWITLQRPTASQVTA